MNFILADTKLKGLTSKECIHKRQEIIRPLVEEFFTWVKQQMAECAVPPKTKTGQGLKYIINQEQYLKVFLTDAMFPLTTRHLGVPSGPSVSVRRIGCSTTVLMALRQVLMFAAYRKLPR